MRIQDYTKKDVGKFVQSINVKEYMKNDVKSWLQSVSENAKNPWSAFDENAYGWFSSHLRSAEILRDNVVHRVYYPFFNEEVRQLFGRWMQCVVLFDKYFVWCVCVSIV